MRSLRKKIGYLGPPGTFSELAARSYLNGTDHVDMVCFPTFADILSAVENGLLEEGILPLENSTEGSVNQTLDLLVHRFRQVKIKNELILPVAHQLLARPGVAISELKKVISHPQILAQCRSFIEKSLPQAEVEEAVSSAEAAAQVAKKQAPWAAIGTVLVAQSNGLSILAADINDCSGNATRFVVVGLKDADKTPGCKTSLIFNLKDEPGALCNVLLEFSKRKINLTCIESRPTKNKLGEYLFYIDFEGHRLEDTVREALVSISGYVTDMRILGSYPADGMLCLQAAQPSLSDLNQLRGEIDEIDDSIIKLLGKRKRLVEKIGSFKEKTRVRDRIREQEIIHRLRALAAGQEIDGEVVETVYRILFDYSISIQSNFLGKTELPKEVNCNY